MAENQFSATPSPEEEAGILQAELSFLRNQVMQLNERLKEVEKHKSSFLSNMRNEIINPFASILGLSNNLLRREEAKEGHLHKSLNLIYQETFALDFHLKTIFQAAEIESGECYPSPAAGRPEAVVAETLVALDHIIRKKKIQIAVYQSFEEDIFADFDKLQMIFLGLLYYLLNKSRVGDGISVKVYTKDEVLFAEMYNTNLMGKKRKSLFEYDQFKELYMFNENIEGVYMSVARSLAETLKGHMEAGAYLGDIAAFRFSLPVAAEDLNGDIFEEKGLIFK